jgi:hypothetical protein
LREVKKKSPIAADHDIAVIAFRSVIFTFARARQQIVSLFIPVARVA